MVKICLECLQPFNCPPSAKTVTCSKACSKARRSKVLAGHAVSEQTRDKIRAKAKTQNRPQLQNGTPAAQASPKSGRFTTNSSAKSWTLIAPDGMQYKCTNLNKFIREHAAIFGISGDDKSVSRIAQGFTILKAGIKKGTRSTCNGGWRILFMHGDDVKNCQK